MYSAKSIMSLHYIYLFITNCVIIISVSFTVNCESICPVPLCVCESKNKAQCMNHEKYLDYIPQLPSSVKILVFVNNYLPHVNRETFTNVSSNAITHLNLTQNRVKTISADAFSDFTSIYYLDLSSNIELSQDSLKYSFTSMNFQVYGSLYLNNISLHGTLPPNFFHGFSESCINTVKLAYNNLITIDGDVFRNMSNLNALDVSHNNILSVNLQGFDSLGHLFISNNNLKSLSKDLNFCSKNGTSLVPHLKTMNIDHNRIRYLRSNDFICIVRVKFLTMSNNPIRVIEDNVFSPLRKLTKLRIKPVGHSLQYIHSYAFNASNIRHLSLAEAYFKFRRYNFDPDNIFRFCPHLLSLVLLLNDVPSDSKTTIKMFGSLLKVRILNLQSVGWKVIPGNLFHRLISLQRLELGDNIIFSIAMNNPFNGVNSLQYLGLGGNKLDIIHKNSLPTNLLRTMKRMNLGRNPFTCNCDMLWFVHWLNQTKIQMLEYPHDYYCVMPETWKGKPLNTFTQDCTIYDNKLKIKIIAAVSISVFVVILLTATLVYKMRWHIRYWIYLIRARRRNYTKLNNVEYIYDGFVVYCDTDRMWVHEKLIPFLENDHGYELCIHYRDFEVGKLIVDNIVENMKQSKKVILVMSNAFAKSEWCQFELLLAHERFLKDGNQTLVTVLLEEVNSEHFTNALKLILTSTTYAIWSGEEAGQRLFWNQLLSTFEAEHKPDYDQLNV